MASLALPLLYSIHESSPASNAHILDIETSVCLWRSIISSSLGETLFPYCQWIKTLRLGNLYSLLEDFGRGGLNMNLRRSSHFGGPSLAGQFFSPPLQNLDLRDQLRGAGTRLNVDDIVTKVGDMIIECIKTAADQQGKDVGLLSLEGPPRSRLDDVSREGILTGWVTAGRLSRLTSLRVHDGSVLNSDLARAIRENCPAFNEMYVLLDNCSEPTADLYPRACYMCRGIKVDATLAGFFKDLAPNTLGSFTINSHNNIGEEAFKALVGHAQSLKRLGLFSLTREAVSSLGHLSQCLKIENFSLEAATEARNLPWDESVYSEVVQWLQRCDHLVSLDFQNVPDGTKILSEVLKSPNIRLRTLNVKSEDFSPELYQSLSSQTGLLQLAVRIVDEDVLEEGEERRDQLVDSICQCHELRELETNELLTIEQFTQITTALPTLEEIDLNGDLIDDSFLVPLLALPRLKAFTVFGPSSFSFQGILDFLGDLASDPSGQHEGFQLYLGDQVFESKFTPDEEKFLNDEMRLRFGGKLDVTYRADPDELHESDFSD